MKSISLLSLLLAFFFLNSCVSSKEFEALQSQNRTLQLDNDRLGVQLETANRDNGQLKDDMNKMQAQHKTTLDDLNSRYQQLEKDHQDLNQRYEQLLTQNQQLLETSSDEKKSLVAELDAKQKALQEQEIALLALKEETQNNQKNLEELGQNLKEREKRVQELEQAIQEKDAKLLALREKINQALRGLSDADLSIREENGKVYVSLSQNLLFRSGSKNINQAGKDALSKLAGVLKSNPDIAITVEGHTDTDGEAAYNWDLSVLRATSVLRELTQSGVDPKRITAAGRGEFFPIAENNTESGKAQNRRTEIILTPDLSGLFDIIEN